MAEGHGEYRNDQHYVVRTNEIGALNHLPPDCPRPVSMQWINRGTDRPLRPTSIDLLLRTLHNEIASESIVKLHRSAGLRLGFASAEERLRFAQQLGQASADLVRMRQTHCSATFDSLDRAKLAVAALLDEGVEDDAISMLWRANLFLDSRIKWHQGHSGMSVVGATLAGGLAGTAFALGLLLVPGMGLVAAAGALAGATIGSVASFGGVAGATGGAIAKMLTDQDVDGVAALFYEQQVERGKVVVSVNLANDEPSERTIREIFRENGGRLYARI